jgi:SAM-dependent methyltransferase
MNATSAQPRLDKLLSLLVCPSCHGDLRREGRDLLCGGCGARFAVREGRPVFWPDADAVKVMPREHVSNEVPRFVMDWLTWLDGLVLNIGAGGTRLKLDNCIEMEASIFRHTDVVGDAHYLPFPGDVFDAVITFNTFEHLRDPRQAASEIHRVLKPGGKLILYTAFLQPVHEAPYHFYNTTEYGLRQWFDAFTITKLEVSENFSPAYVIGWLAAELLAAVEGTQGPEAARQLAASSLAYWRSAWTNKAERDRPAWQMLGRLPQEIQKRVSAGFHLEAVKPDEAGRAA